MNSCLRLFGCGVHCLQTFHVIYSVNTVCVGRWNVFPASENHQRHEKAEQQMCQHLHTKMDASWCRQLRRQTKRKRDYWKWVINYRLVWVSNLNLQYSERETETLYLHEIYLRLDSQSHDRTHSRMKRLVLHLSHSIQTVKHHNNQKSFE